MDNIKDFFSVCENKCNVVGDSATFYWSLKDVGFGELRFYKQDGITFCDNECMSADTVKRILGILVDSCKFTC